MKKPKEVDPCYQEFVRLWFEQYPDLGFNAVAGKKIKELIKSTRQRIKLGGKEDTTEAVIAAFKYVLNYVKRINHWVHGKPITVFEQHYLSIVREIREGKPKPAQNVSIFSKFATS